MLRLVDNTIVSSNRIVRLIYFVEIVLLLWSKLQKVRSRSAKYPILTTIYYTLLGYAVLNSFLTELPSNTDRTKDHINESPNSAILQSLNYVGLLASGDWTWTTLSQDIVLLFAQDK